MKKWKTFSINISNPGNYKTDYSHPTFCAEKLGLSTAYFNDLLKFETGNTLQEYFQLKRLKAAKKMLLKGKDSPSFIAQQLGYPNVQYFSLIFKKIMGMSPTEYRYSHN